MSTRYINMFRAKAAYDGQWMFGDILHGTHIKHPRGTTTIIPDTVGMYAEMIDKHGTRVFEHDILRYTTMGTPIIGEVRRDRGSFWLYRDNGNKYLLFSLIGGGEVEVIGNIFDDPQLIAEGE
ncbi:MAG: hypothetical protein IJO91_05605 [Oscillospiraceae bacterium]|nr:hypothetical protein [Oscillospiraceae bacterium]